MINYEVIITAASDYIYAMYEIRKAYPKGYTIFSDTPYHDDFVQKHVQLEKSRDVLWALSEMSGISVDVAVNAARIENRYYEKYGGTRIVDAEKLIRVLSETD